VRFSSATAGSFSKSIAISSNGGSKTVTATAVAHKVSFSPAQVDFGSGLFVLREQCDSMGSCRLRTEKVGLPIEKALTVKNEGTVSVSLTLSTAAPYKIVSVPPTLSPGQSAQVILRFDPSRMVYVAPGVAVEEVESGEFRGSLQVGISEGQGSLTVPLVGTAHKIEIEPAVLSFGLVFVGTSREQKLIVENKGITTVRVEVLNSILTSPFQLTLAENPMILTPGKSVEATIRFNPFISGDYTESLRLAIGGLTKEIMVRGAALTLEEFMTRLRTEGYPTLYTEHSTLPNLGFLFAGISDLSLNMISLLEQMYSNQPNDPNEDPRRWNQIVQALQLLESINPDAISGWLSSLQQALIERGEDGFREEYEHLFSLYSDFQKYVVVVLALHGELPLDIQLDQIPISWQDLITSILAGLAVEAAELIKQIFLPPEAPPRPMDGYIWTLMWHLREAFKKQLGWDSGAQELWKAIEDAWANLVLMLPRHAHGLSWSIYMIGTNILKNVSNSLFPFCGYSNCNKYEAMKTLMAFLQWSTASAPGGGIDRLEQAIGTLYALGLFALSGWHMHGFVVQGSGADSWAAGLAFLPRGSIQGYDKGIVLVLRGDHCTDCAAKAQQISQWVDMVIGHINSREFSFWGYRGEQAVITLVFTNSNAKGIPTVISTLESAHGQKGVAIAVIYFEKQSNGTFTVKIKCIGQRCAELERAGVLERIRSDYARAIEMAMRAYPGYSPEMAWWLAYGICGGDPDCIKFLADALEEELKEKCGNNNICSGPTPQFHKGEATLGEKRKEIK
jgi:hypothetical protein